MADFANARPTCLAAQIKMILYLLLSPIGVSVFPVAVGAIYNVRRASSDGWLNIEKIQIGRAHV